MIKRFFRHWIIMVAGVAGFFGLVLGLGWLCSELSPWALFVTIVLLITGFLSFIFTSTEFDE